MQESIEQQLMEAKSKVIAAKREREDYAANVYDERGKMKKRVYPSALNAYYRAHKRLMDAQQVENDLLCVQRKQIMETKLVELNLSVGESYFYPRTGTTGILVFDNYGYTMLTPTSEKNPIIAKFGHNVGLTVHTLRELQKVNK